MSPDGFIALQLFDIFQQNGCLKISKCPVFTLLALSDGSESSFLSDIEFFQYKSINNFISLICKVWRWSFENIALSSEFLMVYPKYIAFY